MNLTQPSRSSESWERKHRANIEQMKRAIPRGKRARAKLIEIAATVPLTEEQRKARG
jgi:hypothetical protein